MPTMHNADMKRFEIKTHTPLKENNKIIHKPSISCFVFVCQQGELEMKSMLLAASLKRYLRGEFECVAAIPQPDSRWGIISEETRALMQTLGVRLVPITNPINDNYPIGHKIACLGIDTSADKIVFLDSDILCLSEFRFDSQSPFSAKPADLPTFTQNVAVWQQVYDLCQLPLPDQRVISSVSGELMLPYFNSGVIAVQNGLGFAKVWAECCQTIDIETSITNKRPWLDQIALPMAVAKLNLAYDCLDERFNFPAHLKPLPKSPDSQKPFLCHYHSPSVLRREPLLNQLVTELVETYPILKKRLLDSPEWAQLLKPSKLPRLSKPFQPEPEAIITGIPRSGTSYLCRLLHTLPDCVVINEPPQIILPLAHESRPWRVATFYQTLRRDILEGYPIENKLQNGQVIEDTAIIDTLTRYQPTVSRADFLLCTKNTLAYLSRLPQLKQVMPHAPIMACVRNPLDTIASWKSTFAHLKHATVTDFPVGHVNDPFLSPWQRDRLAEIAAAPKDALKRALLWRYLAECILTDAAQLTVVRYEELVLEPAKVLQTILDHIPNAPPLQGIEKITPSTVRQKRELLDTDDLQAIREICSQYAAELGYSFYDQPKNQESQENHVGWVERSETHPVEILKVVGKKNLAHPTAKNKTEKSSKSINILVIGKAKTGTTVISKTIQKSITGLTNYYLEPKEISFFEQPFFTQELEASNVVKIIFEHWEKTPRIRDAIVHNQTKLKFDKVVYIVRDMRDEIISKLMYSVYRYKDNLTIEQLIRWIEILQKKEKAPKYLPFLELIKEFERLFLNHSSGTIVNTAIRQTTDYYDFIQHVVKPIHIIKYEDFISGKLTALQDYLGFPLSNDRDVDNLGRTKRTTTFNNWKKVFTPEDVDFFQPKISSLLEDFGYIDWALDDCSVLEEEHYSGYIKRLLSEDKEKFLPSHVKKIPNVRTTLKNLTHRNGAYQLPKAIIILGMHRSGTSALTGVLNQFGVDLGAKLLPNHITNERGFWENSQVIEINEKILKSLHSSWDDIAPLPPKWWQSEKLAPFKKAISEILRQNFATCPLWGIKDPRLYRLLPLWLPILEASGSVLHFVIVTRNPHEVAASLEKRDGLSANTSFQLWLENTLAAEKQTQSYSRVFVTYDELLQDWQSTVEKIARVLKLEFAHSIESVQDKITAFLSTDLKHHHQLTTPDLDPHLAVYGDRVYQTFIAAAQGETGSLKTLNPIRQASVKYSRSQIQAPKTLACQHVYDILIPIYNAYDEVNQCIESVIRHTDTKHRLFLMDDASTDSRILPLLTRFAQNYPQITVLPAENHLGLVANLNRQLNCSENDIVILASDTQVTPNWLEKMERCLKSDPAIGIVSPLSNHATLLSVPVMNEHNRLNRQLIDFAQLIENCSVRRYPRIPTAGGSCLLITRQTLNQLGDFDEAFAPGYGVECDYSMRAWRENIEIACCDETYIYHVGGASLESVPNSERKRHQNKQLLDKRWPRFHEALSVFCQVNPLRDIQESIYTAIQNDYRPQILHVLSDFDTSDHFSL